MNLSEELQRQAVMHGVADAIAGVTRLQIVDGVYDEDYWEQYRAGLAAWEQAESQQDLPAGYRPEPAPGAGTPGGLPHPGPSQAARGWHTRTLQLSNEAGSMHARDEPAASQQPFALALLGRLRETGESAPGPTVLQGYQQGRLAELERQWAAEPPAEFGLDADGPEAG